MMWFQSITTILPLLTIKSPVAQWLEHSTRSQRVVGLNPVLSNFLPFFFAYLHWEFYKPTCTFSYPWSLKFPLIQQQQEQCWNLSHHGFLTLHLFDNVPLDMVRTPAVVLVGLFFLLSTVTGSFTRAFFSSSSSFADSWMTETYTIHG